MDVLSLAARWVGGLGILVVAGCGLSAGPTAWSSRVTQVCQDGEAAAMEDRGMGRVAVERAWRMAARCPAPDWPARRDPAERGRRAEPGRLRQVASDQDSRPWGAGGPPAPRDLVITPLGAPMPRRAAN
jgi:hypothetical protein